MLDLFFFFFKQKTAYEMRISDWSSDVCSSDLGPENQGSERSIASREYRQLPAAPMSPRWGIYGESRSRQHKRDPIRPFRPTHRWRWRSEERRVGKECVRTCRTWGSASQKKLKEEGREERR